MNDSDDNQVPPSIKPKRFFDIVPANKTTPNPTSRPIINDGKSPQADPMVMDSPKVVAPGSSAADSDAAQELPATESSEDVLLSSTMDDETSADLSGETLDGLSDEPSAEKPDETPIAADTPPAEPPEPVKSSDAAANDTIQFHEHDEPEHPANIPLAEPPKPAPEPEPKKPEPEDPNIADEDLNTPIGDLMDESEDSTNETSDEPAPENPAPDDEPVGPAENPDPADAETPAPAKPTVKPGLTNNIPSSNFAKPAANTAEKPAAPTIKKVELGDDELLLPAHASPDGPDGIIVHEHAGPKKRARWVRVMQVIVILVFAAVVILDLLIDGGVISNPANLPVTHLINK